MNLSAHCFDCGLCKTRHNIVWGAGPEFARIMFVAEGPGEHEDIWGTPFYYKANAGREYDRLLGTINLDRANVYTTNTVKCRPPGNRDPYPDEIAACRNWLLMEIGRIQPKIIVTVGAISTKNFLGEVNMEAVHGIPFETQIKETGQKVTIIPCYHPAAGLRSPEYAQLCALDFANVGAVLRGKLSPAHFRDPLAGSESYGVLQNEREVVEAFDHAETIAVDTETLDWKYTPFVVSASAAPGTGYVIFADNADAIAALGKILADPRRISLIHNCLFDIFVLEKLGIYPATIHDTMIMAYLLQSEPQGLKPLAFRYWGMIMKDYEDMVAEASAELAAKYLRSVLEYSWPNPEKILEIKPGGIFHYKQPQNVAKVVQRIFKDLEKGKIGRADLWRRWHKLDPEETGRDVVEAALGEMPEGNLSMVPQEDAVWYACRDADATIRVHPYLWSRIQDTGMEGVFEMDMGIVPMVKDMMETGIAPIPAELERLGNRFGRRIEELEAQITALSDGQVINVGSPMQVADLLYQKLHIRAPMKHGKISTNDKTLARLVAAHPVVPLIRNWRTYSKLKTTYTDKLLKWVAADGRIHTQLKITRTSTGRLASANPNIMNQPTRNEDGKAIRKAFAARDGCVFVSNDLSQIEMRVLTHESGDARLIHIFKNDLDIHSMTACGIFKLDISELDEMRHRYPSKRVGFGVVYGITAPGLQEQLLMMGLDPEYWTIPRCQQLIDDWFAVYPDVQIYMEDLVAFARRHGYVCDMFGRRRYLETIRSSSNLARSEAARQAGNQPIQCLPGSTRVLTSKGFCRIASFVDGDLVWTGNSWARARLVKKGKGQLVDVKLDDGMIFTCDTAHKVLVANRAYPEWRSVISLKPGDILARSLEKAPDGMHIETAEFWYWIGRYYGDGHLTQLARGQVRPTTGKPGKEYRALVDWAFGENKLPAAKKLMKFLKRWGGSPRMEIQRKGKSIVYRVKDRKFNKRMIELGITPNEVAWTKRIADVVFTLSPRFREMFVQGYYDADGTTRKHYKKGWATRAITSVNRELLQDTALILRSLGKRSYINGPYRNRDPHRRPFYRLCTHSDESTLRKVVSVRKRARKEDVYTLMVSDPTHSFDSEGVISKNSGAAGIFKAGMKNLTPIYKDFLKQGYVCWPVLPIHDDLVFEVSEDIVHIWVPLQQDIMEHSVTLKVPIKSDAKVGKIWGDQKKYKW